MCVLLHISASVSSCRRRETISWCTSPCCSLVTDKKHSEHAKYCAAYRWITIKMQIFWKYCLEVLYLLFILQISLETKEFQKIQKKNKNLLLYICFPQETRLGLRLNLWHSPPIWDNSGADVVNDSNLNFGNPDPWPRTSRSCWLDSNANFSEVLLFIFNSPSLRHASDTSTIMLPGLKKMWIRVLARFLHRRLLQFQYFLSHSFRILGKNKAFLLSRPFFFFQTSRSA